MPAPLARYVPDFAVSAAGREWLLGRAGDLETLWERMAEGDEADAEDRIPYWTELWPSSLALCSWLLLKREEIAGRPCLDLGCGLGLTALVARWLGARVLAMDREEEALRHARRNAELNGVGQPLWAVMDWRRPALAPGRVDYLWGGDVMYERRFVEPVLRFCSHAVAQGGFVWIAEPGRGVYGHFLSALSGFGWRGREVHERTVEPLYEGAPPAQVTIWELRRG